MNNQAQKSWKYYYRLWKNDRQIERYLLGMDRNLYAAALERALAAANRRVEKISDEYMVMVNNWVHACTRIYELEGLLPVAIKTSPAAESEMEKLE